MLLFKSWLRRLQQHFAYLPILVWLNILTIVILTLLSVYAKIKSKGSNIEILFSDPFNIGIFYLGWLTGISETLWCGAIAICLFTAILLPKTSNSYRLFLLVSASIMTWLYFDDRFRLTLILCVFFGSYKIVKTTVYFLYGLLLIFYGTRFRRIIRNTPYIPLLLCFCLFAFSSAIDITPMSSRGLHAMLEDGTKLIGLINLTIYFGYVCQKEINKYLVKEIER